MLINCLVTLSCHKKRIHYIKFFGFQLGSQYYTWPIMVHWTITTTKTFLVLRRNMRNNYQQHWCNYKSVCPNTFAFKKPCSLFCASKTVQNVSSIILIKLQLTVTLIKEQLYIEWCLKIADGNVFSIRNICGISKDDLEWNKKWEKNHKNLLETIWKTTWATEKKMIILSSIRPNWNFSLDMEQ